MTKERDRVQAARTRLAAADKPASDSKVQEVTGRTWEAWFSILDSSTSRRTGSRSGASRTIAVPAEVAFDAFVDSRQRKSWLTDGTMSLRTSQPGRTARFDWENGSTRVSVSFEEKGPSKTAVAVAHERLPVLCTAAPGSDGMDYSGIHPVVLR
jgi:hypothetical protein